MNVKYSFVQVILFMHVIVWIFMFCALFNFTFRWSVLSSNLHSHRCALTHCTRSPINVDYESTSVLEDVVCTLYSSVMNMPKTQVPLRLLCLRISVFCHIICFWHLDCNINFCAVQLLTYHDKLRPTNI